MTSERMPKLAVISPTHILGKKKEAWVNFESGNYIAMVSRIKEDLSSKSIEEIMQIVKTTPGYDTKKIAKNDLEMKLLKEFVTKN